MSGKSFEQLCLRTTGMFDQFELRDRYLSRGPIQSPLPLMTHTGVEVGLSLLLHRRISAGSFKQRFLCILFLAQIVPLTGQI